MITVPFKRLAIVNRGEAAMRAINAVRELNEELKGRGVEFVDAPEERPYGIDASFRDPSGNHIRLTQVQPVAAV